MTDFDRYLQTLSAQGAPGVILRCRDCTDEAGGMRVVRVFEGATLSLDDLRFEAAAHEHRYHEPVLAGPAEKEAAALEAAADRAERRADAPLPPEATAALVRLLREAAATGRQYPGLIQDHNRKTCDDFTCAIHGHVMDLARALTAVHPEEGRAFTELVRLTEELGLYEDRPTDNGGT